MTSLVAGAFTPSVLLRVARRLGHLDAEDLDVAEVPVASSSAQFRSLIDGGMDVAFTSPDNVLAYRFSPTNPLGATADVSIVSSVDRGMGLGLYGRAGLSDPRELRGAVLAVDVPTSGFALAMYALTMSLGLGREAYEVAAIGSTPKRLQALLAGNCSATLLNAGNELLAEQAGCVRLAAVADVCSPYLGTVLAVAGSRHLAAVRRLARALRSAAAAVHADRGGQVAAEEAGSVLGLSADLARRYVDRLRSPTEGLVDAADVDLEGLGTVVALRRRFLPETVDGVDVLADALEPSSGLVASCLDD